MSKVWSPWVWETWWIPQLRLRKEDIDALVRERLAADEVLLMRTFPEWNDWPADAQLGLLSMAWAMGAGFTKKWPNFKAACASRNWAGAVRDCRIKEAGDPGVVARNDANVLLFHNAHRVEEAGLDGTRLYYPETLAPLDASA